MASVSIVRYIFAWVALVICKLQGAFSAPVPEPDLSEVADILGEIRHVASQRYSSFLALNEKQSDGIQSVIASEFNGVANTNSSSPQNSSDILVPKANFDKFLFEGDILLTSEQAIGILEDLQEEDDSDSESDQRPRFSRSALYYNQSARWTTFPIKYDYDYTIGSVEKQAIQEALEYWRTHTCIWFEHRPGISEGDYLMFFKGEDDSCYSHVGRIGGKQLISIGKHCGKMGYVAHEVGHALGMWHEQARPDSDLHIEVLWQNIVNDRASNFMKRTWQQTETYGLPYDMGSVMHYGPYAFTYNEKVRTIQARLPGYQFTIGQREAPSFLDVKAVNMVYCENKCKSTYSCKYGGYTHPGFCNGCICPEGLGGTYCGEAESSKNANCGGLVYVDGDDKNISSPNYPEHYDNNQRCSWFLRSPSGSRIMLEFIDVFQMACAPTCTDYIEIKNDTDFTSTGMRFCCFEKPSQPIFSQDNEMLVIFNSGYTTFNGFKARVAQYPNPKLRVG